MTDLLFVYGTLMRRAANARLGREMRARLEQSATWLGEAQTAGRLFDLGRYPALIAPASPADVVHGEVFRLAETAAAFQWLDRYEGIPHGRTRGREYERIEQSVTLETGTRHVAWIYRYLMAIPNPKPVPDGRWLP